MSLLKRVEQAQRRASALDDGTVEIVVPPPVPVMAPSAGHVSAREALLRQIRLRLQAEVMIAFTSLLDIDGSGAAPGQGRCASSTVSSTSTGSR